MTETYHPESKAIFDCLKAELPSLHGGTQFQIGDISIDVQSKDGLGGLIEEWFGVWALQRGLSIDDPKKTGGSQEFPDYYVGAGGYLEVKAFDHTAGANFDLANFESYCTSLASNPDRLDSDYLIFGYVLNGSALRIENVWLKKIWEITCASQRWPIKTQTKRDVIYNIRPAAWASSRSQYPVFTSKDEFVDALYSTQEMYRGRSDRDLFMRNTR